MEEFFTIHTKGASPRAMEKELDGLFSYSTIARQLRENPSAELIIALARAYEINPLSALVAAEYITEAEAARPDTLSAIEAATDVELAEEILRRAHNADSVLNQPIDVSGVRDNVHHLRPVDELEDAGDVEYPGDEAVAAKHGIHKADEEPPAE